MESLPPEGGHSMKAPRITVLAAQAAESLKAPAAGKRLPFFKPTSRHGTPILGHVVYIAAEEWRKLPEWAMMEITSPDFIRADHEGRRRWLTDQLGYTPKEWQLVEKGITIRQPWAWAILEAGKDCENRSRRMAAPGWYYVHTSATCTAKEFLEAWGFIVERVPSAPRIPNRDALPLGSILGIMQITGWTPDSASPWFMGPMAAEIGKTFTLPSPIPCKGSQGVFYAPRFEA